MSMQGYLKKRNERGVWQQRWFVLQGLELKYYNSQKDATGGKDPKGVIPVMTVQSAEYAGAIGGENHCFEIKVSSRTEKDRTYQLSAISSAIAKSWCSSIDTTRDAFRATGQRSGHTVTSAPASRTASEQAPTASGKLPAAGSPPLGRAASLSKLKSGSTGAETVHVTLAVPPGGGEALAEQMGVAARLAIEGVLVAIGAPFEVDVDAVAVEGVADHGAHATADEGAARAASLLAALSSAPPPPPSEIALAIAVSWGTTPLPTVDGFAPIGSASAGGADAVLEHLVVAARGHGDAPGVDGGVAVAAVSGSQLERPPPAPPAPAAQVALLQEAVASAVKRQLRPRALAKIVQRSGAAAQAQAAELRRQHQSKQTAAAQDNAGVKSSLKSLQAMGDSRQSTAVGALELDGGPSLLQLYQLMTSNDVDAEMVDELSKGGATPRRAWEGGDAAEAAGGGSPGMQFERSGSMTVGCAAPPRHAPTAIPRRPPHPLTPSAPPPAASSRRWRRPTSRRRGRRPRRSSASR